MLWGASGAGKSSLIRCLNLLHRPTTGAVYAAGLGNLVKIPGGAPVPAPDRHDLPTAPVSWPAHGLGKCPVRTAGPLFYPAQSKDVEAYLGKVQTAKREGRYHDVFDVKQETQVTFNDLAAGYVENYQGQKCTSRLKPE